MDNDQNQNTKPQHPVPEPLSDYPELEAGEEELELPAAGRGVTDVAATPQPTIKPYTAADHIPVHRPPFQSKAPVEQVEPEADPTTLHDMNSHPAATPRPRRRGMSWLSHTRLYVLEYLLANLFLLSFIWLSNYPIYYLASYILGNRDTGGIDSNWILFTVSYAIVVFPLQAILLRRTVGEEETHPARLTQHPRKVLLNLAVFYAVIASVGYGLAAVYLMLSPLIKENSGSHGVAYGLASLVMVGLHLMAVVALTRRADGKPSRLAMAIIVSSVALVLSFTAFGISVVPTRNVATDRQSLNDLRAINDKVVAYVRNEKKLPNTLSQLDLSKDIQNRQIEHKYEYEPQGTTALETTTTPGTTKPSTTKPKTTQYVNTNLRYKLCAVFKTSTAEPRDTDSYSGRTSYLSDYSSHPRGKYCFSMETYSYGIQYPSTKIVD